MIAPLRKAAIRMLLPLAWRSPARMSKALSRFASTELDSAWQSLQAVRGIADPAMRAKAFRHAVEEMSHAEAFAGVGRKYAATLQTQEIFERHALLQPSCSPGALVRFFADEYVGEKRIHQEFQSYWRAISHADVKAVFHRVMEDEQGHVLYAAGALKALTVQHGRQRWLAVLGAQLRYFWGGWLRFSKRIGQFPIEVGLRLVYLLSGAFLLPWRRRVHP